MLSLLHIHIQVNPSKTNPACVNMTAVRRMYVYPVYPDSNVHGVNMGSSGGRQNPADPIHAR